MVSPIQPAGTRVLVVDDTEATRYSTVRILNAANAHVTEAHSGEEALAMAPAFDVIVLDVKLPGMDGYEVCRRLRQQDDTRNTPIVHFSAAYVSENNKIYGLESGADAYLIHPVEPQMLVATVNTLLRARRAEDENQRSSRLLGTVFRTAGVGIGVIDAQDRIVEANPAFCSMLGIRREALFGRQLESVAGRVFATALQRDEETGVGQSVLRRADGSEMACEWNAVPVGTGDRVVVVTDISRRRRLEQERETLLAAERQARADAENANATKDEFLAVLSHELRNPLNNILGWTNILRRSPEVEQRNNAMAAIDRNVYVQVQLVEDLLDVSRIAAGMLRMEKRRTDAGAAVREAVQAVAHAAQAGGIAVEFHSNETMWLDADPARLQQIVSNLLSNAIKFSQRGGTVTVSLERLGTEARLGIQDAGIGIAPELLPYVFERFRQGDSSTTRRASGLGLGLAIVKSLVDLHGGRITVSSAGRGQGTRFDVYLPLQADEDGKAEAETAHAPQETMPLDGRHILIVDDSPEARRVLSYALEDWGAHIEQAGSATEALQRIDTQRPDMLISDISMPDVDGYDLIQEVRARYDATTLPALALTAFAREEDIRRILAAGFQGHIAKPVDVDRLLQRIQQYWPPSTD